MPFYLDEEKLPLPVTVPMWLHEAMSKAESPEFAISYLCGALLDGDTLRPRTFTARRKLGESRVARELLKDNRVNLGEPIPPENREDLPQLQESRDRYKRTGKF